MEVALCTRESRASSSLSAFSSVSPLAFFLLYFIAAIAFSTVAGSTNVANELVGEDFNLAEVVPRLIGGPWQPRSVRESKILSPGFEQSENWESSRYCDGQRAGMYMIPTTENCSSAYICFGEGQGYFLQCDSDFRERQRVSFTNGEFKCGNTCALWHTGMVGHADAFEPMEEGRVLQSGMCADIYKFTSDKAE
ncbi:hypothetical protein CBR_g891 [Chara braunii]|uniref:Uncharacterized protein n=1 Tax=Chara braunii TaxID=69332 RepID=A0A388KCN3_CHABU|nr:hypothetical protein CBR_g891 [Chara braunii]|eukprot:GBG67766.1 hypothetical protein CBR_g891 [Chara braunii]